MSTTHKFQEGQRVMETGTGEKGTVLQYASKDMVIVEFDNSYGADTQVCEVAETELALIFNEMTSADYSKHCLEDARKALMALNAKICLVTDCDKELSEIFVQAINNVEALADREASR